MKRVFAGSRSLLVIVAMVMITAVSTVSTARAAPSAGNAAGTRAVSNAQCNLRHTISGCQSTDPTVTLSTEATGNTSDCTFVWDLGWGDGHSAQATEVDPADGWKVIAQHTYSATGTYTVTATGTATSGCTLTPFVVTFTLLAAPSSPPPPPANPSPAFVCVTGPGGSCLEPGAGVPTPATWAPDPPGWLTSPVTGGCVLEFVPGGELFDFLSDLGNAVQYDESNGNFFVLLRGALVDSCTELAYDVLTHHPLPQNLRLSPESRADQLNAAAPEISAQRLFRTVPRSQLKSLKKLPFLRQRLGYAVAETGAAAALSKKYKTSWSSGTQKSVVCHPQRGGYRCNWRFQHKGTHRKGYILIAAKGNSYRLEKVVQL
jgi:PKD domain